ncbi:MAG: hypothetical protein C5B50_01875 [Verrucomicrobia bacterium]|nr:MAG: hypothetical protein C5B50_01875 [Verrucomicrobiota bacterium]
MARQKAPIRNGLRDITVAECANDPAMLAELVERKRQELPVNARKDQRFAQQLEDTVRLLQAVGARSYPQISLRAVLDVLLAVDYFLVLEDDCRDSRDQGYEDDAKELNEVFLKHQTELNEFRLWFSRQQQR